MLSFKSFFLIFSSYDKFCFVEHESFYVSTKKVLNTNIGLTIIIGGEEELNEERNLMKRGT